jgi:hypothetical protein
MLTYVVYIYIYINKLKIITDSKSGASKHLKLVEFSVSLLSPV